MSTSLSKLVNNLSEMYKNGYGYKPVYDFIGLKNNKLDYKCSECKKDN